MSEQTIKDYQWRHEPTYEERKAVREWERVFNS